MSAPTCGHLYVANGEDYLRALRVSAATSSETTLAARASRRHD
jgi:hypothetical protein